MKNYNISVLLKSLGAATLLATCFLTHAQQDTVRVKQERDTLEVYFPGGEIIIIQKKDSAQKSNPDVTISFPSNKRYKDTNAAVWSGLYWGFTGFMNSNLGFIPDAPYDFVALDLIQSRQIQLNLFEEKIPLYRHKLNLVTGIGLRWNRYRFTNNIIYANANRYPQLPSQTPYIGVIDSSGTLLKSSLNTRSLTVPLLLNFCFNPRERVAKQANLSMGLVGSATYRAFSKTVYAGKPFRKSESIRDDYGIIPLGVDATVKLRMGRFNLYAEYGLHSLFFKNRGPEVNRFSIGLALLSF